MITYSKYPLAFLPTPLHKLENLSNLYPDYQIFIKRDDQTGLATGGNKTRKLEYLIQQAVDLGCNSVITAGAQQSNHCRQTAAACALAKLDCHLLLNGEEPNNYQGNLLLSHLLGATLHFSGKESKGRKQDLHTLKKKLTQKKDEVYVIPVGGSNLIGALGYIEAIGELKKQLIDNQLHIDYIFFASSSGGTQAGLTYGIHLHKLKTQLLPILIDKEESFDIPLEKQILHILQEANQYFNTTFTINTEEINIIKEYNKADYGELTNNETFAINLLAKQEGILLDPVYTGRAFYGMLDFLKNKKIPTGSSILFWHTGGTPALHAYAKKLRKQLKE